MTARPYHLTDAEVEASPDDVARIRAAAEAVSNVEVRTIGGRLAVFERGGDALAFIVTRDPGRARAICEEWSDDIALAKRKAGER